LTGANERKERKGPQADTDTSLLIAFLSILNTEARSWSQNKNETV